MGIVPVFRYVYGTQFNYIPIGMMEGKIVVFIVGEGRNKLGIMRILPVIHESNKLLYYMSILEAGKLIRTRIESIRKLSSLNENVGFSDGWKNITELQKDTIEELAINEMSRLIAFMISIVRLQRNWRRAITNPMYHACKKRLIREYNLLLESS